MGMAQSSGAKLMDQELFERFNTFPDGLELRKQHPDLHMSGLCIYPWNDPEVAHVQELVRSKQLTPTQARGLGCFMGMMVGDAMGAPLEFSPVRYGSTEFSATDKVPVELWTKEGYNTFGLKPGQWTDDASMGICLADTLLVKGGTLDPQDLRLRFLNWWTLGLNNAFGFDDERSSKGSVGLGGNISQSMSEFVRDQTPFTLAGDRNTSGNGSVMRNAAVPLCFHRQPEQAAEVGRQQSRTTHQGVEAAECAAVMSWLGAIALSEPTLTKEQLLQRLESFPTEVYSVQCLVRSQQEERRASNEGLDLADRDWNWRNGNFRFAPSRAASQPGYVGSYAMDALAMALHCVWSTDSFTAAVLKTINLRGDADSTGSVTAQLAGCIYGIHAIPQPWMDAVQTWDGHGMSLLKAWRLMSLLGNQE